MVDAQWTPDVLLRLHHFKAAETAVLASITPLLLWALSMDVRIRHLRMRSERDYFRACFDYPRWLPLAMIGVCAVVLYALTRERLAILRAVQPDDRAAIDRDARFRGGVWPMVIGAVGTAISFTSEFSIWQSAYTPLALTAGGAAMAWCRAWGEVKYGFTIPAAAPPRLFRVALPAKSDPLTLNQRVRRSKP